MMKLLFWLILYPLSLLPMPVLYFIAWLFYLLNYYIIRYRRKVIVQNLERSFPEKSPKEIAKLTRQYYHHLSQLAAEMLKMLTLSRRQLAKRYYCANPEVVNKYFEQGKSVILMSSHYNDWEWMVLSLDSQFKHHGVGVGKPNSNKDFEKLINRARTRYGTEVVFADTVRETFERYESQHVPVAYMMLSDQSPSNPHKSFGTMFLNQPSCMLYGAEHFAKKYNLPVVYYQVIKDRIGHYHLELELITENPVDTEYGYITKRYVALLEQTIRQNPPFWLWSHRRWKHTPDHIDG